MGLGLGDIAIQRRLGALLQPTAAGAGSRHTQFPLRVSSTRNYERNLHEIRCVIAAPVVPCAPHQRLAVVQYVVVYVVVVTVVSVEVTTFVTVVAVVEVDVLEVLELPIGGVVTMV